MIMLRRSDSVINLEILESLIFKGPLRITNIACIANINCNKLKKILDKLDRKGFIIQKHSCKDDSLYLITSKGLDFFRESKSHVLLIR
jgi:predicted transcriptional regulator